MLKIYGFVFTACFFPVRKTMITLMKKLLLHLVAEFKRLGAVIIFADFNRILISTKKRAFVDANAYVEYISKHIRNKVRLLRDKVRVNVKCILYIYIRNKVSEIESG